MTQERNADRAYACRYAVLMGIAMVFCGIFLLLSPAIDVAVKCWFNGDPLPGGFATCWKKGWAEEQAIDNVRWALLTFTVLIGGLCLVIVGIVKRPRRR